MRAFANYSFFRTWLLDIPSIILILICLAFMFFFKTSNKKWTIYHSCQWSDKNALYWLELESRSKQSFSFESAPSPYSPFGISSLMSLLQLLTCQRCAKTNYQAASLSKSRSREDIATCVRIPGLQPTAATSPQPTSPRASTTIVQAIQRRQLFQKMFHIYFWTVFWKKKVCTISKYLWCYGRRKMVSANIWQKKSSRATM